MTTKQATKEKRVLVNLIKWGANKEEAESLVKKGFPTVYKMMPDSSPTKIAECLLANW